MGMSRPLSPSSVPALPHPVVVSVCVCVLFQYLAGNKGETQAPCLTLALEHPRWAAWGLAGGGGPGEGVGRASGGDEVKVTDAAQQAVEEAGDASVSPGAGRGVNERRRRTLSNPSVHPGMAAAQGPVDASSQNRSVVFQEVEPAVWCQADWDAGLGVGRGAEWSVPGRGRHSQPERQTAAKATEKVASVQRSRKS